MKTSIYSRISSTLTCTLILSAAGTLSASAAGSAAKAPTNSVPTKVLGSIGSTQSARGKEVEIVPSRPKRASRTKPAGEILRGSEAVVKRSMPVALTSLTNGPAVPSVPVEVCCSATNAAPHAYRLHLNGLASSTGTSPAEPSETLFWFSGGALLSNTRTGRSVALPGIEPWAFRPIATVGSWDEVSVTSRPQGLRLFHWSW